MSDLSFLIQNHNEVKIDESFLEKCQNNNNQSKSGNLGMSKVLSSKEIKVNKTKNIIAQKLKPGSPRSYNLANQKSDETQPSDNEMLSKITMRIEALEQNQKNMEKKIGIEFFNLKSQIQKRNQEQNQQFQEVRRIKSNLFETKKNIAELLTMITKKQSK